MKQTYYLLRKDDPELKLKVEISGNDMTFSGEAIPQEQVGKLNCYYETNGYGVIIQSVLHPALTIYGSRCYFYLGGRSTNRPFVCRSFVDDDNLTKILLILNSFDFATRAIELNKQIHVL